MTIVVDNANIPYKGKIWCHMAADDGDIEALHQFAHRLGMSRDWLHDGSMPHYDVTLWIKRIAIENGAIEIDVKQMVAIMKAWRESIE